VESLRHSIDGAGSITGVAIGNRKKMAATTSFHTVEGMTQSTGMQKMRHWDVIERFQFDKSHPSLSFSGADTRCSCKESTSQVNEMTFSALCHISSGRSSLSVRIDEVGTFSFGIATAPFPPETSEMFGERIDSWGFIQKGKQVVIGECGEYFSPAKALESGDIISMDIDLFRGRVAVIKNAALLSEFAVPKHLEPQIFDVGITMLSGVTATILPVDSPYGTAAWLDGSSSGDLARRPVNDTRTRFNQIFKGLQQHLGTSQSAPMLAMYASVGPGSNLENSLVLNYGGKGSDGAEGARPSSSQKSRPKSKKGRRNEKSKKKDTVSVLKRGYIPPSQDFLNSLGSEAGFLKIPDTLILPHRPRTAVTTSDSKLGDGIVTDKELSTLYPHLKEQRGRIGSAIGRSRAKSAVPSMRKSVNSKGASMFVSGLGSLEADSGVLPVFFSTGEITIPDLLAPAPDDASSIHPHEDEVHDRINDMVTDGLKKLEDRRKEAFAKKRNSPRKGDNAKNSRAMDVQSYREILQKLRYDRQEKEAKKRVDAAIKMQEIKANEGDKGDKIHVEIFETFADAEAKTKKKNSQGHKDEMRNPKPFLFSPADPTGPTEESSMFEDILAPETVNASFPLESESKGTEDAKQNIMDEAKGYVNADADVGATADTKQVTPKKTKAKSKQRKIASFPPVALIKPTPHSQMPDDKPSWRPGGTLSPPKDIKGMRLEMKSSVVPPGMHRVSNPLRCHTLSRPLTRLMKASAIDEVINPKNQLPAPLRLTHYRHMNDFELLISVEHCYHCTSHITLKHDPIKYDNMAMIIKSTIELEAATCWPKADEKITVRSVSVPIVPKDYSLGVLPSSMIVDVTSDESAMACDFKVLLKSQNTSKTEKKRSSCQIDKEQDKYNGFDQRIGALEVQVAYKCPEGLAVATIHSKLASRQWPNITLVVKRLRRFLEVCSGMPCIIPEEVKMPEVKVEEKVEVKVEDKSITKGEKPPQSWKVLTDAIEVTPTNTPQKPSRKCPVEGERDQDVGHQEPFMYQNNDSKVQG